MKLKESTALLFCQMGNETKILTTLDVDVGMRTTGLLCGALSMPYASANYGSKNFIVSYAQKLEIGLRTRPN